MELIFFLEAVVVGAHSLLKIIFWGSNVRNANYSQYYVEYIWKLLRE